MALTVVQIDEKITALESAKTSRLTGEQRKRVGYERGQVEFADVTIEEINLELLRLRAERQRLTGEYAGVGPIRVGFGSRP
jgi:hypothetical protein